MLLLPPVRAAEQTPRPHAARSALTYTPLSHSVRRSVVAHSRAQEEGRKPLVDALLQGTTALAVGHDPDGAAFGEHLARLGLGLGLGLGLALGLARARCVRVNVRVRVRVNARVS